MKILTVKDKKIIVEMDIKEFSQVVGDGYLSSDKLNRLCREDQYIPIGKWADEFKSFSLDKNKNLLESLEGMVIFYKNRIKVYEEINLD